MPKIFAHICIYILHLHIHFALMQNNFALAQNNFVSYRPFLHLISLPHNRKNNIRNIKGKHNKSFPPVYPAFADRKQDGDDTDHN